MTTEMLGVSVRAADSYLAGLRAEESGDHEMAWKHYEKAIALYCKCGRIDDADYVRARCRDNGYML